MDDMMMDASKYLRAVVHTSPAADALVVDKRTLALALADPDAARARVSALEDVLRDVCEAAVTDLGRGAEGWYVDCQLCASTCDHETGELFHAPGCPVAAALRLLEPGT